MRASRDLKWAGFVLLLILFASAGRSQPVPQPAFEVASVKAGGDLFSTRPQLSPGRFLWTSQLVYFIGYAYGVDFSRVSGEGLANVYTISAVCDPKTPDGELRLMLQSLLRDRFNLRVHRVGKQVDGSAISIAKNGIRMKESVAEDEPAPARRNFVSATVASAGVALITGRAGSMSQLAETLARVTGSPFWDKTGLEGKYDFAFRFAQDLSTDPQPGVPSLLTALRELGLVLEKQRGSVDTIVVDRVDPPSAN